MSPDVGRPALKPATSPVRRYVSGRYSASAVRHSRPNEKFTGPAQVSNASPDSEATATCCSAFVTFSEWIAMASTAAGERLWPKMFATGAVVGLGRSNACAYWLREAAPSCVLVSSDLA